jgi:hypothetical protein
LDPPIAVRVEPLERLAKLLDDDAGADKAVEGDASRRSVNTASRRLGFKTYPKNG